MLRRSSRLALFVAALAVVAWQSLVPGEQVLVRTSWDKFGHAAVYVVLGALAVFAMQQPRFLAAWGGVVAFGLAMEMLQGLGGHRSFEVLDLVADAVGAALGSGLAMWQRGRRSRART